MISQNVLFFDPAFPRSGIHCDPPEGLTGLDAGTLDTIALIRNASKGSKILRLREDECIEDAIPVVFREVVRDEEGRRVVGHNLKSLANVDVDASADEKTQPKKSNV